MNLIATKLLKNNNFTRFTTRPFMGYRSLFSCSQANDIFMDKGQLEIRNSETFEIKLYRVDTGTINIEPISIQINPSATLKQLSEAISGHVPIKNMKFLSQENLLISELTPIESLLNRFFTIMSSEYKIKIEGQFMHPNLQETKHSWKEDLRESLKQIQHPIFIQRQIQAYIHRIDTWLDARYGIENQNAKVTFEEAQAILIQALVDPDCPWNLVREIEGQWRKIYNEVDALKLKYQKAVTLSSKKAKTRMYLDLVLLSANIGFIWGGTYIVYSWDIIQPWAYFITSAAGIFLFRKAAQFRKPFSLANYRNHLIYEVYLKQSAHEVGLDLEILKQKQKELKIIEATFKDYLMAKL